MRRLGPVFVELSNTDEILLVYHWIRIESKSRLTNLGWDVVRESLCPSLTRREWIVFTNLFVTSSWAHCWSSCYKSWEIGQWGVVHISKFAVTFRKTLHDKAVTVYDNGNSWRTVSLYWLEHMDAINGHVTAHLEWPYLKEIVIAR